ncbi:MAG TPA: sugar-binding protein [bacterium]|nr:sugar-binding protein [bacterium]HOL35011.1 sugar-binding protein [bacterium]HPP07978.1 sugar-binding protein [bacterium]
MYITVKRQSYWLHLIVFSILLNLLPALYSQEITQNSPIYCFDFGPIAENPEPGFVRISPDQQWKQEIGYGWMKDGVIAVSRKPPDDFRKGKLEYSFHEGTGVNIFRISLSPGKYRCWLVAGDMAFIPPCFSVTANGDTVISQKETTNYIPRVQTWLFDITIQGNNLDLQFKGCPHFLVCGMVVAPVKFWNQAATIIEKKEKEFILAPGEQLLLWTEKTHPSHQVLTNNPQAMRNGLVISWWPSYLPVYPNSVPTQKQQNLPLWSFGTPGESEPISFLMCPLKNGISLVSANITHLSKDNRIKIANTFLTLRVAKYRPHRTLWTGRREYEWVPELLEKFKTPLQINETKLFWLTVNVPRDAQPGLYRGTIIFKTSNANTIKVPIMFVVLPFILPKEPAKIFGMHYLDPLYILSRPEINHLYRERGTLCRLEELLQRDLVDMKEHGISSICDPGFRLRILKKGDQIEYTLPVELIEKMIQSGVIKHPFFGVTPMIEDICAITGDPVPHPRGSGEIPPPFSNEFNRIYVNGIRFIQQTARERKWPEVLYYVVDEPCDPERKEIAKRLCNLVHQVPGARTLVTGSLGEGYLDEQLIKLIDVIKFSGAESVPEQPELQKGNWFYPNDVAGAYGNYMSARFLVGFGFWFSQLAGVAPWRYNNIIGSPDTDLDGIMSDFFFNYPVVEENIPTLRWENWKEGFDDCRYMTLLEDKIQKGKTSNVPAAIKAASNADKEITHIKSIMPTLNQFASGIIPATSGVRPDEGRSACEEWMNTYCQKIRWAVANHIIAIDNALKKKPGLSPKETKPVVEVLGQTNHRVQKPYWKEEIIGSAKATHPVVIDGDFTEECWKHAKIVHLVNRNDGSIPKKTTEVMVAADSQNLYFAFKNFEPFMNNLAARITSRDAAVWDDDCVEVFIGNDVGCQNFYQFVVNSNGAIADAFYPSGEFRPKWNSKNVEAGVKKFPSYWQVELKVPREDVELSNTSIAGINMCREEKQIGELTCWSTSGKGFAYPADFGRLNISDSDCYFSKFLLPELNLGPNQGSIEISNRCEKEKNVAITTALYNHNGIPVQQTTRNVSIPRFSTICVPYEFNLETDESCELQLKLLDQSQGTLYDSKTFQIHTNQIFQIYPDSYYLIKDIDTLQIFCHISISKKLSGSSLIVLTLADTEEKKILYRKEIPVNKNMLRDFIIRIDPNNLPSGKVLASVMVKPGKMAQLKKDFEFCVLDGIQEKF